MADFTSSFAPQSAGYGSYGAGATGATTNDLLAQMMQNQQPGAFDWTQLGIGSVGTGLSIYDQYFGQGKDIRDLQEKSMQQNLDTAKADEARTVQFNADVKSAFA